MEQLIDIKNIIKWLKNPRNKKVTYILLFFVIGLLFLTLNKFLSATSHEGENYFDKNVTTQKNNPTAKSEESYEYILEDKLTRVLNKINGVEGVNVIITLEDQAQIQPAFNTTSTEKNSEEKDNEGGVRTITETQSNKQVVIMRKGGEEEPVVLKKVTPKVKGVLIVAEKVTSSEAIDKLTKATATLLDVPIYKISVLTK